MLFMFRIFKETHKAVIFNTLINEYVITKVKFVFLVVAVLLLFI